MSPDPLDVQACFPWRRQPQVHKEREQDRFPPFRPCTHLSEPPFRKHPLSLRLTLSGGGAGGYFLKTPPFLSLCAYL